LISKLRKERFLDVDRPVKPACFVFSVEKLRTQRKRAGFAGRKHREELAPIRGREKAGFAGRRV
jgi:hypothetical protein